MKTIVRAMTVAIVLMAALSWVVATPARATVQCDAVVVLGDSLESDDAAAYADTLAYSGWPRVVVWAGAGRAISTPDVRDNTIAVNWDGSRGTWRFRDAVSGLDSAKVVRWLAGARPLCWVVALGTNDMGHQPVGKWPGIIQSLKDVIGGDPALWVNVWADSSEFPLYSTARSTEWNRLLMEAGVTIFDWAATAREHPSDLQPDGIHATPKGTLERATMIADLLPLAGCACTYYHPAGGWAQ